MDYIKFSHCLLFGVCFIFLLSCPLAHEFAEGVIDCSVISVENKREQTQTKLDSFKPLPSCQKAPLDILRIVYVPVRETVQKTADLHTGMLTVRLIL